MYAPENKHGRFMYTQQGFSLVELMVSLIVSLLVCMAAFGSARLFMLTQRQSVDAGTAGANAVTALAAIKHEAEQSSLGFYVNGTFPCQTFNLSARDVSLATNTPLLPVNVSNSTKNLAKLDLLYADSLESSAAAYLSSTVFGNASSAATASYLPVRPGQTVMLVPLGDSGLPCSIKTAVRVDPPASGTGSTVYFDDTGLHNQFSYSSVSYSTNSAMTLLGTLNWSRFSVDTSGNLVMTRPILGGSVVLARNVVGFQVQYGVSDGVTSNLDSWQFAEGAWTPLSAALMARVRALRIGLVLRSDQPERAAKDASCKTTTTQPVLLDRAMTLSGNWQCYRYRTSTAIVPLRNVLIGSST